MRFINLGESMKIRIGSLKEHKWITLETGEKIDLKEEVGRNNGLKEIKVTKSQAGPKIVETKQFEKIRVPEFEKELQKIKGIGAKTAWDITKVYSKEKLIEAMQQGDELPFRDDVEGKLREKYGKN